MAVDAAQPTSSSPPPTTQFSDTPRTRTRTHTRSTFTSSSSPSTSSSNTSYKLSSTASTSSQTSLGSFRLSLPENPNLYDFSEILTATNNFLAKRLSSSTTIPSWCCTFRDKALIGGGGYGDISRRENEVVKLVLACSQSVFTSASVCGLH